MRRCRWHVRRRPPLDRTLRADLHGAVPLVCEQKLAGQADPKRDSSVSSSRFNHHMVHVPPGGDTGTVSSYSPTLSRSTKRSGVYARAGTASTTEIFFVPLFSAPIAQVATVLSRFCDYGACESPEKRKQQIERHRRDRVSAKGSCRPRAFPERVACLTPFVFAL